MPMVWYIPPLSPVVDVVEGRAATTPSTPATCSAPSTRCASRSSTSPNCSPPATRRRSATCWPDWRRCARTCATSTSASRADPELADAVGLTRHRARGHVPAAGAGQVRRALRHPGRPRRVARPGRRAGRAGLLARLRGRARAWAGPGPFGESSGGPQPIAVENFHALRQRQTSDEFVDPADGPRRVNLLNWDGKGAAADIMPPRAGGRETGNEP